MRRRWSDAIVGVTLGLLTLGAGACSETPTSRRDQGALGDQGRHDTHASADGAGGDVPSAHRCGDKVCDPQEDCRSCPQDCGGCTPKELSFSAIADTTVDEGAPTSNFGANKTLFVDQNPDQQVLLRFVVAGLDAPVAKATLHLFVANETSDGPKVYRTSNTWQEMKVTWASRTQPQGNLLADLGTIPLGWIDVDVTPAVLGNGEVSFVLLPTSTNGVDFDSRESTHAPQLVVRTAVLHPPRDDGGVSPEDGSSPGADSRVDGGRVADGGSGPKPFSFFVLGDTRSHPDVAQQCFHSIAAKDPKAITLFNTGDITHDGEVSQWKAHTQAVNLGAAGLIQLDATAFGAGHLRYFGVIGNHDIHLSSWRTNWNTFLSGQKSLGHNAADGIWYSFVYGNALFIVLDSEHSRSTQTTWLQKTLAAAAGDPSIVWRFAFYHQPVYPCNYKSPFSDGIPWVREFEKYGVDMVFNGHAHVYERTCKMIKGSCQKGGVVYVTTGGGGAGTVKLIKDKTATAGPDHYDCSKILDAGKGYWHHYCHLRVDGRKLTYACYAHTETMNPEDKLTINK